LITERAKNILEDKRKRQFITADENNTRELTVSVLSDNIGELVEVCWKKG
jgi:hypothetical protein